MSAEISMTIDNERPRERRGWIPWALIVLGALLSLLAFFQWGEGGIGFAEDGVKRFSFDYLWGFVFLWSIVLGSLFFVALHHVTGAVWSAVVRRVAEMLAAPIAMVAVLFIPVLVLGVLPGSGLFPWMDAEVVKGDHILEQKALYLNIPFFAIRAALFFGIWFLYARIFVGRSLLQDAGGDAAKAQSSMRKASTHFMVVYAFTVSFAAIDWLKSLDPHWFSTIYGVYVWGGMVVTALAVITLATLWLDKRGQLGQGVIRSDHLYNLGALLFAFSCFWGYIAFSQFMLIWYANIPEETIYFKHRLEHGWEPVSIALALVRFALPFLLLLSRRAKTNPRVLVPVCALIILGQWLDLYWLIMPQFAAEGGPFFGIAEFGPLLLMSGILLFWMGRFSSSHAMLPSKDPVFLRSCEFHL